MILFLNVFITDNALNLYDRGRIGPASSRYDVFKYALASYSVIDFSKVIIYYKLDTNYADRYDEMDAYIRSIYKDPIIYHTRIDKQCQWKDALQEVFATKDDDLVWFFCNDDHIYLDYDNTLVERIKGRLGELSKDHEYLASMVTHWPEYTPFVQPGYCLPDADVVEETPILEATPEWYVVKWEQFGSGQIVNYNLLRYWWFEHDYGDAWMPRTDNSKVWVKSPKITCIIPMKELVRHFDGSSHVGTDLNGSPPLGIPPGFFEKNMVVRFYDEKRQPGVVHCNPLIQNYSTVDPNGVDYRFVPEDIPLFWKKHITRIEFASHPDEKTVLHARNEAILHGAIQSAKIDSAEMSKKIKFAYRLLPGMELPVVHRAQSIEYKDYCSIYSRSKRNPKLSILVVDSTGVGNAKTTFDSLQDQDCNRDDFEIVFVSAKNRVERSAVDRVDAALTANQFEFSSQGTYHVGRAVNEAFKEAKGQIVTIADSQTKFAKSFVRATIAAFQGYSADYGYFLHPEIDTSQQGSSSNVQASAKVISVTRSAFIAISGADEHPELCGAMWLAAEVGHRLNSLPALVIPPSIDAYVERNKSTLDRLALMHFSAPSQKQPKQVSEIMTGSFSSEAKADFVRERVLNSAVSAFIEGEWQDKLARLQKVISCYKYDKSCDLVEQSFAKLFSRQLNQAIILASEARDNCPNSPGVLSLLALYSLLAQDVTIASNILMHALSIAPHHFGARCVMQEVLHLNCKYVELEKFNRLSYLMYPHNEKMQDYLAVACQRIKNGTPARTV